MADSFVAESIPNPNPYPNCNDFASEFDSLQIPPLDSLFFSVNGDNSALSSSEDPLFSDLGLGFGDNDDFEFTFDDIDLYLPSETEDFLIPEGSNDITGSIEQVGLVPAHPVRMRPDAEKTLDLQLYGNGSARMSCSSMPESGSSENSGEQGLDVSNFPQCTSPESRESNRGHSPPNSAYMNYNASRVLNFPSPEHGASDGEASGGPIWSQGSGSGNCGSGISEGMNYSSPDLGNYGVTVDQKIKVEGIGKHSVSKRKKGHDEGNKELFRSTKYQRSSTPIENLNPPSCGNDEEDKRKARLMRNRESAQLSRQRKKHYVEELEDKVRNMHSTITELNSKISYIMAENASLRHQLSGGAMCQPPAPPPGMYPHPQMTPMAYPWMPCAPYVVKPQGSQVPLVPIPRLKSQQAVTATKLKKKEGKKVEGKTKKVASVSFLGLVLFILFFGGFVPVVNVNFGGRGNGVSGGLGYVSDKFYDPHRGRVLSVGGYSNGSKQSMDIVTSCEKFDISTRVPWYRYSMKGQRLMFEQNERASQALSGTEEFVDIGNASEPLVASLYVPRNDKLVKIDGNLIIHSVLASDKTMQSRIAPKMKNQRETSLAISKGLTPALAIPEVGGNRGRHPNMYRDPTEVQKALASASADNLKDHTRSTAADGKLQQWFREGLAGPMLSSGMCTEVFQFNVSPASVPGAIIPASSVRNASSMQHRQNSTQLNKGRNRRALRHLPVPFAESNLNFTEEAVRGNLPKDKFQGNTSVSPMVVSVLVDPREAGDIEVDGIVKPKSLSKIFVVVLLDSVKYVTYSCVLPRSGPHLVTT